MSVGTIALLGLAASIMASPVQTVQDAVPSFPREMRGMWVATVWNIDWPTRNNLTTTQQRNEAIALLDLAKSMNLNMVVLQVRTQCDAFYPSAIEPWSPFLTGLMYRAPSPLYDPLQFWIEEAHRRGISLHAWFNPYRALVDLDATTSPNHISRTRPDIVRVWGDQLWLDPGHPDVRALTTAVIADVVQRYDVDGVHLDDYFYPYPISGQTFPDDDLYAAYLAGGGTLSRSDWRRQNVNTLVRSLRDEIHRRDPWVMFGISPFGIWRPGHPPGITGLDAFNAIFADSRLWLQEGWVDYLSPQLYWPIAQQAQSYTALLDWWILQNTRGRHIWPGNFTSQLHTGLGDWPLSEILNQITETRRRASTGNLHFSARAFRNNWKGVTTSLSTGLYATPAAIPASPWLDSTAPAAPLITIARVEGNQFRLEWVSQANEPIRKRTLYTRYGGVWSFQLLGDETTSILLPMSNPQGALDLIALGELDRVQNESPRVRVRVPGPRLGLRVSLQDFVGPIQEQTLQIDVRQPGGAIVESFSVNPNSSGVLAFTLQNPGAYDIAVKGSRWLRARVPSVTVDHFGVDLTFSLINGDVDGSNRIDGVDFMALSRAFRSRPGQTLWNPNADLNGDRVVDGRDFVVLSRNFRRVGQ